MIVLEPIEVDNSTNASFTLKLHASVTEYYATYFAYCSDDVYFEYFDVTSFNEVR